MREELSQLLQALEQELRTQDRWDETPPPAAALRSTQPFAVDALSFEQWLQWILLPKLNSLLAQRLPLPTNCAIRPMAEEVYGKADLGGTRITQIVAEIDVLLTDSQDGQNG